MIPLLLERWLYDFDAEVRLSQNRKRKIFRHSFPVFFCIPDWVFDESRLSYIDSRNSYILGRAWPRQTNHLNPVDSSFLDFFRSFTTALMAFFRRYHPKSHQFRKDSRQFGSKILVSDRQTRGICNDKFRNLIGQQLSQE